MTANAQTSNDGSEALRLDNDKSNNVTDDYALQMTWSFRKSYKIGSELQMKGHWKDHVESADRR